MTNCWFFSPLRVSNFLFHIKNKFGFAPSVSKAQTFIAAHFQGTLNKKKTNQQNPLLGETCTERGCKKGQKADGGVGKRNMSCQLRIFFHKQMAL